MKLKHFDVKTAFLFGELEKEVYIEQLIFFLLALQPFVGLYFAAL